MRRLTPHQERLYDAVQCLARSHREPTETILAQYAYREDHRDIIAVQEAFQVTARCPERDDCPFPDCMDADPPALCVAATKTTAATS